MPGALHFKLVIGEWEALVLNGAVQCKPLCPPPAPHPVTAGSRSLLPQELDGDGDGAVSLARKAASAETHEQGTPPLPWETWEPLLLLSRGQIPASCLP